MTNNLLTTNKIVRKRSKYTNQPVPKSTDKKINFGSGNSRKKKVSLANIKALKE